MEDIDVAPPPEQTTPRFEIEQPDDYAQYLLHAKAEIVAVLRSLIQRRALVSAYFNQGSSFLLTAVLSVEADAGELLLDWGREDEVCRQALLADSLILTATVDKVKVQFVLRGLSETRSAGRPAFRAALPAELLRLQRRECFRLSAPVARPIKFMATLKRSEGSVMIIDASLLDISAGGIGLMATPVQATLLARGSPLTDCKIALPDEGLLIANLCVRNRSDVATRGGSRYVRVGCEFVDLPGARMAMVQRYITRVERERKARLSGMA